VYTHEGYTTATRTDITFMMSLGSLHYSWIDISVRALELGTGLLL